jgi:hypothetical protein
LAWTLGRMPGDTLEGCCGGGNDGGCLGCWWWGCWWRDLFLQSIKVFSERVWLFQCLIVERVHDLFDLARRRQRGEKMQLLYSLSSQLPQRSTKRKFCSLRPTNGDSSSSTLASKAAPSPWPKNPRTTILALFQGPLYPPKLTPDPRFDQRNCFNLTYPLFPLVPPYSRHILLRPSPDL